MLRMFTPEFLHSNVRLLHGEQDNQLLLVYFKSLFSLQMIKGRLTPDGFKSYDSACSLLLSIDRLNEENSEHTTMMIKPYLRLVQFAYPQLVKVFAE